MNICFINPPFKAEYGKFSRESRSPAIGHSGVLYYPLWLIYAAALAEKMDSILFSLMLQRNNLMKRRALTLLLKKQKILRFLFSIRVRLLSIVISILQQK